MTVALLPMPNLLKIEPRIWLMLHKTTAGKKTSDKGAVVVLKVVTTEKQALFNFPRYSTLDKVPVAETKSLTAV